MHRANGFEHRLGVGQALSEVRYLVRTVVLVDELHGVFVGLKSPALSLAAWYTRHVSNPAAQAQVAPRDMEAKGLEQDRPPVGQDHTETQ